MSGSAVTLPCALTVMLRSPVRSGSAACASPIGDSNGTRSMRLAASRGLWRVLVFPSGMSASRRCASHGSVGSCPGCGSKRGRDAKQSRAVAARARFPFPHSRTSLRPLASLVRQDAMLQVGPVAQRLELTAHNRLVTGSNPVGPTKARHATGLYEGFTGAGRLEPCHLLQFYGRDHGVEAFSGPEAELIAERKRLADAERPGGSGAYCPQHCDGCSGRRLACLPARAAVLKPLRDAAGK